MKTILAILIFSCAVQAQERFVFWSSEAFLIGSAIADHKSGLRAQRLYDAVEKNPIGNVAASYTGPITTAALSYILYKKGNRWQKWLAIGMNFAMAGWHFSAAKHNWGIK